jgi:hypothetical protein
VCHDRKVVQRFLWFLIFAILRGFSKLPATQTS